MENVIGLEIEAKTRRAEERYGKVQKISGKFYEHEWTPFLAQKAAETAAKPVISVPAIENKPTEPVQETILDKEVSIDPHLFAAMQADSKPEEAGNKTPVVSLADAREAKRQAMIIENSRRAQETATPIGEANERFAKVA